MNKKLLLLITLALALILAVPALTGCNGPAAAQDTTTQVQISQQPQGIWVSGTGEVTVTPDIAILRLGIVAQEVTVVEAQTRAAEAMNEVMKALTEGGVPQKDIQTGPFSISQRTRWDNDRQTETVIGYQVTNMVTAKIRVLDMESYTLDYRVGRIIAAVVQVGGDLTRINGLNFSVDDPADYYEQAREKAMADAKEKAEQLATLAGVTLGKPTYVAEVAQVSPVYSSGAILAIPAPAPAPTIIPPISTGETKVTLTVQVAYSTTAIDNAQANSPTPTMNVRVNKQVIADGIEIHLEGTTDFNNGTLHSQLYENQQPLDWWPSNQEIKENGYKWEITVPLGKNGAPYTLKTGISYQIKLWEKDNPQHWGMGGFFISAGPPSLLP